MRLDFRSMRPWLATAVVVAAAAVIGWQLWAYYMESPWTRDGRVRADVVLVAPDVAGLVAEVAVADNQFVHRGDVLFRIDAQRYVLAMQEAEATLANNKAILDQARRDEQRALSLGPLSVSKTQQEQAIKAAAQAQASYDQAAAALALAQLNVARTQVTAPVNGLITNLELRPGDYVNAGQSVLAQIDADSFYVSGYFEETKLPRIHMGDPVSVRLMGEGQDIRGHVDSIAHGIVDRERAQSPNLLPNVNPTFSWVRLAQRVPVRIAIDSVPKGIELISGRTATVRVLPGGASPVRSAAK
jgi:multidrug resistance efflux pump